MKVIKFAPGLIPVLKHLAGQHDQKTHGRWASSGLPHELENVRGSLQKYFDSGAIAKAGEITRARRSYRPKEDGSGYETVTTREPVRDTLDQPFMTFRAPDELDDPEGAQIFKEYEAKMLGGNYEEIQLAAQQEAVDNGMGSRQALYYGQAIASRASLYVTMHNEALRQAAAEKVYSRDFGDYQEKGSSREYFEQRAKTMKTLSENISKAQPVVAIETDAFLGVVKDGRFKTQYETRESNGAYRPALRKEAELAISGVPLDTKSAEPMSSESGVLRAGPVVMDLDRHTVSVNGEKIQMPLKEFELLELLMENVNRVLTRGQIIDRVWGSNYFGDTKTLDVHVKRVRSKIEDDPSRPRHLMTVRGLGYKFEV